MWAGAGCMSECVDKLPSNAKATTTTTIAKAARTTVTEITVQLTRPLATCHMPHATRRHRRRRGHGLCQQRRCICEIAAMGSHTVGWRERGGGCNSAYGCLTDFNNFDNLTKYNLQTI